ncbi:MAG: aconitate hydratase, partial [Candidatus Marinimicrobia bacterium]|nr:aconitate hydratase [Candidatus Neomarinimicrobiota bacterium]
FYDQVIEIDLSTLEPYVVGPFTPDLARPISKLGGEVKEKNYPEKLDVALIGSCTNSSYEDIERSAHVVRQAIEKGLMLKSELMISPGSEKIRATIHRDGQLQALEEVGGVVLANACGPCIGQWTRHGREEGEKNSIITSFNRNFARRNDGNSGTHAFIASPELVTAMAFGGAMTFNPLTDTLINQNGEEVKLDPPVGDELPKKGFERGKEGFLEPPEDRHRVKVTVYPESERLQLLSPFDSWDGQDLTDLPILLKAKGKCTTDHISPAGPWLRFRGHLDNISNNMFIGAVNVFSSEAGMGTNILTGEKHIRFSDISRDYKSRGIGWVVVGDDNYGEGSSREHAAMEPRYLGARAIIVKSFARIHETNLKKQGVLALTFANPDDYEKIQEDDRISIIGLDKFTPGKLVKAVISHADGKKELIELHHSYSQQQIDWFKAGSALNKIREDLNHQ